MTATPIALGPGRIEISPYHLSVSEHYDSGSSHNVHLLHNGDLGVMLMRGNEGVREPIPAKVEDTGIVVVSLDVDDDHDEVHFDHRNTEDAEEVLGQAIEALVLCREALLRVRKPRPVSS